MRMRKSLQILDVLNDLASRQVISPERSMDLGRRYLKTGKAEAVISGLLMSDYDSDSETEIQEAVSKIRSYGGAK